MKISLSKKKIVLSLLTTFIICFLGTFMLLHSEEVSSFYKSPLLAMVIGAFLLVFSFVSTVALIQFLFKGEGVSIDSNSLFDDSSLVSVGLIEWDDITSIRTAKINTTRFLLIDVKNPEEYLSRFGKLKSWWLKVNAGPFGTPISISAVLLECSFDELENRVREAYEKNKKMSDMRECNSGNTV
ncbi:MULTISPECIES: STM3941 family protein [Sphingobacterium]|uniref:STM3941 family protein n=1 Tax=Sphingobacterium TaxID=28453 RepID=UPI0013DC07DA|nr:MULTISPECIES: STM3941 family protein [unclassified Sphingobacterium]